MKDNKHPQISYHNSWGERHDYVVLLDETYSVKISKKRVHFNKHEKSCTINTLCNVRTLDPDKPGYDNVFEAFLKWRNS